MNIIKETNTLNILYFNIINIGLLFLLNCLDYLQIIDQAFQTIIDEKPLPGYYFIIFAILTVLLPVIIRLFNNSNNISIKRILDQYLILLASQIIMEIFVVILIGKGTAVLIGFIYSISRVYQLNKLLEIGIYKTSIKSFLKFQLILWLINILQIIINRIIPFYYFLQ